MTRDARPIGVFDSGVGGLTVLRALVDLMPRESFIYVGDTARVPYGTKSPEAVRRFSLEVARFLRKKRIKLMVTACNTVSALALPDLRRLLPVPVLGVIEPGARAALAATRRGRIAIIGTEATVRSRAYEQAVHRLAGSMFLISRPCPLFVPLVEEGWSRNPVTRDIAAVYLKDLPKEKIDTLILGCTHYPLLKPVIRRVLGPQVELIDSAEETAKAVRARLEQDGLLRARGSGSLRFFSSDDPAKFQRVGQRFLGRPMPAVERIRLEGVDAPRP